MSSSKFLNISEEEKLCEVVRDYPILYDKSQKGYKERDAVENAWNEVSSLLDFVQSGTMALNSLAFWDTVYGYAFHQWLQ